MLPVPDPLHPMIVHFPIALFMTAFGLEMLSLILKKESFHQTALHIFIIAALITPWVVWSGIWEAEELNLSHPVFDQHRTFAFATMWLGLASLPLLWIVKREWARFFRIVFVFFLIGIAVCVSITGRMGGRMVYEYGVGVDE